MDLCWQSNVSAFEEKEWKCVSPAWLGSENKKFWGLVWISFFLLQMSLRRVVAVSVVTTTMLKSHGYRSSSLGTWTWRALGSFVNNGGCSPTARCWKRQAPIPPETLHLSAGPHGRRRGSHACEATEGGWTSKLQGEPNKLFSREGSWRPANLAKLDTKELLSRD